MTQATDIAAPPPSTEVNLIGTVSAAHLLSHFYMLVLPPLFLFVRNDYGVSFTELGIALAVFNVVSAVFQTPAGFLPADTAICASDPFIIHPLKLFNEHVWSTGASANSITVQTPGIYRLQVKDNDGCIVRDSIGIFTKDCSILFFVPDTFTPNNDGINDSFKPLVSGRISDYEFTVYNIYGQIVFNSRRINDGWNGMYRNLPQNAGTYVWICRYKATNEAAHLSKGSVLLMR